MGILKYAFPPWYLYAFTRWSFKVLKGIFWMPFKVAAKFDSWWKKLLVFATMLYVAIPGSIPYALLQLAKLMGYEEEAQTVIDVGVTVAKAMWTAGTFAFNMAVA